MGRSNYNRYLIPTIRTLSFILTIILIFSSCSNSKLMAKKKQFEKMSDKDLLNYYHQIIDQLDHIDRDTNQKKVRDNIGYDPDRDRITHLHIGDTWGRLQQEKKLVLNELMLRNIKP